MRNFWNYKLEVSKEISYAANTHGSTYGENEAHGRNGKTDELECFL